MQAQKLALSHFLETITLCRRNVLLDTGSNVCAPGFSIHAAAYDLAHDLPQGGAVLEPEGIGLAHVIRDTGRRVLTRG